MGREHPGTIWKKKIVVCWTSVRMSNERLKSNSLPRPLNQVLPEGYWRHVCKSQKSPQRSLQRSRKGKFLSLAEKEEKSWWNWEVTEWNHLTVKIQWWLLLLITSLIDHVKMNKFKWYSCKIFEFLYVLVMGFAILAIHKVSITQKNRTIYIFNQNCPYLFHGAFVAFLIIIKWKPSFCMPRHFQQAVLVVPQILFSNKNICKQIPNRIKTHFNNVHKVKVHMEEGPCLYIAQ